MFYLRKWLVTNPEFKDMTILKENFGDDIKKNLDIKRVEQELLEAN